MYRDTILCICMVESLCRPPEIIITLLTGYTAIGNKKLFCFFLKAVWWGKTEQ